MLHGPSPVTREDDGHVRNESSLIRVMAENSTIESLGSFKSSLKSL